MTKYFLTTILLFVCIALKCQTQKGAFWIEKDSTFYCKVYSEGQNCILKECYTLDSTLMETKTYLNNKLTGIKNEYFRNGLIRRQEEFLNGKNTGDFLEYNLNGTLWIKGFFAEGDTNSLDKQYCGEDEFVSTENPGILTSQYCFSSPRQGKWTYYADNGKIYSEGYYKNNKRIGEWSFYNIYTSKLEKRKNYGN